MQYNWKKPDRKRDLLKSSSMSHDNTSVPKRINSRVPHKSYSSDLHLNEHFPNIIPDSTLQKLGPLATITYSNVVYSTQSGRGAKAYLDNQDFQ